MSIVDERILEYLNENDAGSPSEIKEAGELSYHPAYIAERARKLADKDFIRRISAKGVYQITERGEAYLAGEYDASVHDDEKEETDGGVTAQA